jgi:hypothetical protein
MNAKVAAIARRRESLIARAAAQRADVASIAHSWQRQFQWIDAGLAIVRTTSVRLALMALAAALLGRSRGRRVVVWIGHASTLWRLCRAFIGRRPQGRART